MSEMNEYIPDLFELIDEEGKLAIIKRFYVSWQ